MKLFLCVIGMVLIIEGLPYVAFPEKIKSYLIKMSSIPEGTLRVLGLAFVTIGLVLVYIGRS